jgi:hypothetical protein
VPADGGENHTAPLVQCVHRSLIDLKQQPTAALIHASDLGVSLGSPPNFSGQALAVCCSKVDHAVPWRGRSLRENALARGRPEPFQRPIMTDPKLSVRRRDHDPLYLVRLCRLAVVDAAILLTLVDDVSSCRASGCRILIVGHYRSAAPD